MRVRYRILEGVEHLRAHAQRFSPLYEVWVSPKTGSPDRQEPLPPGSALACCHIMFQCCGLFLRFGKNGSSEGREVLKGHNPHSWSTPKMQTEGERCWGAGPNEFHFSIYFFLFYMIIDCPIFKPLRYISGNNQNLTKELAWSTSMCRMQGYSAKRTQAEICNSQNLPC